MRLNRHSAAVALAALALGAGLAVELTEGAGALLEDAGVVVVVVTLVILAVEVPRIVLRRDARRGIGRS